MAKQEEARIPSLNLCGCFSEVAYTLDGTEDDANNLGPVYKTCGRQVAGEFAQGHDAKLKSVLQKAYTKADGGDGEFRMLDGGLLISADPMEIAKQRGWERFLTKATETQTKRASRKARKAKGQPGDSMTKHDKIAELEGMKAAARRVKAEGIKGDDGKPLQVTHLNWRQIVAEGQATDTPPSPDRSAIAVGDEFKISYRGTLVPATVTEIKGNRAKVTFAQKTTGKTVSRVIDLETLRRS